MTKTDYPILGKVTSEDEEKIKSINEKQAERKIQVMNDLDKIKEPLMVTVLMGPDIWEYRNLAFWKALERKDRTVREMLRDYITKKSPRR